MQKTLGCLFLLFFITACAQDFSSSGSQSTSDDAGVAAIDDATDKLQAEQPAGVAGAKTAPEQLPQQQPVAKEKQSEQECTSLWTSILAEQPPLSSLEQGKIIITFFKDTSYEDALDLLQQYRIAKDQIVEIFPVGKPTTDQEKFSWYRTIKGSIRAGQEVAVACKILQEDAVAEAAPNLVIDFSKLAQANK